MRLTKYIYIVIIVSLILSCGGGDDGTSGPPTPPDVMSPVATTLIFPEDDTVCNISEILSETQSRVTFQWNNSENTDSYELSIRNLNTGNILTSITNNTGSNIIESPLIIQRGTPYEWSVISMAEGTTETATSQTFRFFNEGPGLESFAPFPAEAVLPIQGNTANIAAGNMVTLEWTTSDIDNDITDFEVFFDTANPPVNNAGQVTESTIDVAVELNQIYFWQIITRDSNGNSSNSPIFQFRTPSN